MTALSLTAPLANTDEAEFLALYESTVDVAWRVLARLGVGSPELEDAVQDVFVVANRRLASFRGDAAPSTWITSIAIRVAHDYRRRRRRKPTEPLEPHGEDLTADQLAPDEEVSRTQAAALLPRLLAQMSAPQREVFVLAEFEQHSIAHIAQLLHIPVNTAYSRLRLARAHFNELALALEEGLT